jgi:signal transduction histidine kinase
LIARSLALSMSDGNPDVAKLRDMATRVADGLNQTLADVTTLARGLVPVEVDAQGLQSALAELASTIDSVAGTSCRFECTDAVEISDNFVATHLFRIAQEAITNALKHSGADSIEISLAKDDGALVLAIQDNGVGMKKAGATISGRGLRIMEYRAGIIGADFQLAPAKGGGTLVTCKLTPPAVV